MEIPDLRPYIKRYDEEARDYKEFDNMANDFKNKTFLTKNELLRIAEWKLRRLYFPKHRKEIEKNTDSLIEETTEKAIKETDDKTKVEILDELLHGVGIPVASAVLTVLNPQDYAVIDINGWYALYHEEKKLFTSSDFKQYINKVREIAKNQGLTAREVDKGLFILGRNMRKQKDLNSTFLV